MGMRTGTWMGEVWERTVEDVPCRDMVSFCGLFCVERGQGGCNAVEYLLGYLFVGGLW